MNNNGWAQYMRDHDIPAEGYPPPALEYEEDDEADDSDYRYELEPEEDKDD